MHVGLRQARDMIQQVHLTVRRKAVVVRDSRLMAEEAGLEARRIRFRGLGVVTSSEGTPFDDNVSCGLEKTTEHVPNFH
jgi:hypothetical protein